MVSWLRTRGSVCGLVRLQQWVHAVQVTCMSNPCFMTSAAHDR
jgi:hypothetical protein